MWPLRLRQPSETLCPSRKPLIPSILNRGFFCATPLFKAKKQPNPLKGPKPKPNPPTNTSTDHRELGTQLQLFTSHPSSPGSPFFHPDGAYVFQKLQSFLRAQYPSFGLREVITPNLYKESLWNQSGHWQNYRDAMFSVDGGPVPEGSQDPNYSLKPMNCPGHCLLYKSQKRSYRDLPIRYADFSPLHRNEDSGSLSGLTRVRRFHQDDGHIFCKPDQVENEIRSALRFVSMAYKALNVTSYKLVLSTRPEKEYLGTPDQWEVAEEQLRQALTRGRQTWELSAGNGAFYGPKIDIVLKDLKDKEHQTATIQLDFQLPQRFELKYDITAQKKGTPVLIHRAVFGSLERFMALMIEKYRGHWPFWLSPRQIIVLTIGNDDHVLAYAKDIAQNLAMSKKASMEASMEESDPERPQSLHTVHYMVDTDLRDETLAKKILDARMKKYNLICFIGKRNVREKIIDLDITGQPRQQESIDIFERVNPGTLSPVQKILAKNVRGAPGIKIHLGQLQHAIKLLSKNYL